MKIKLLICAVLLLTAVSGWGKGLGMYPKHVTSSYSTHGTAKQVTIVFTSDFTGTVNGVSFTFAAGGSYTWNTYQAGDTLAPIAIVVTTGSADVTEVE